MKKFSIGKAIQPKSLSQDARNQLVEKLYAVHEQIFDGVDKEAFRRYVVEPDTVLTKIFPFENKQGELVGYLTFQVFQAKISCSGDRCPYVYRTETGVLPEYRGGAPISRFLFLEFCKFSLLRRMPEAYFMATPINPVAYCIASRSAFELYPRQGQEIPSHIAKIMDSLSSSLKLNPGSSGNRFVKNVGWRVKMNQAKLERLKRNNDEDIQFYLRQNPGFTEGDGMMMVAPATLRNGFFTAGKLIRRKFKVQTRRMLPKTPPLLQTVLRAMV